MNRETQDFDRVPLDYHDWLDEQDSEYAHSMVVAVYAVCAAILVAGAAGLAALCWFLGAP